MFELFLSCDLLGQREDKWKKGQRVCVPVGKRWSSPLIFLIALSYHFAFVISILCHQDRKSEYQRKKSSCWTTKSHLICPSFYSHGKVARNVNCEIEFASSVTLGAGCESVTVASCESETEAKCKLIRCRLRSERSRRQNPALRNSGKQCQGHNSHTTLWIAQDQPHIPF